MPRPNTNAKLRYDIETNDLRYWEVADRIGITNSTLSVWFRTPMNGVRLMKVEKALRELIEEKMHNENKEKHRTNT